MPDFADVARQLDDEGMLKIAEPLGLCDRLKSLLAQAPEPDSLPVLIWQEGRRCQTTAGTLVTSLKRTFGSSGHIAGG